MKPRAPVALFAALLLVAGVEGGIRAWPDEWIVPSRSWLGEYTLIERNLRARDGSPRVVVMGSSRGGIGLVGPTLDKGLGLPVGSTVNVSLQGGRPSDALRMYRRNREILRQAKLVVFSIDEWHFSTGWPMDPRYRLHAPLEDRLALAQPGEVPTFPLETLDERRARERVRLHGLSNGLLLDHLFNGRVRFKYIRRATVAGLKGGFELPEPVTPEEYLRRMEAEAGVIDLPPERVRDDARFVYRDFDVHPVFVSDLRELISTLQRDGVRVVLFQLPNRGSYQDVVDAEFGPSYELFTRTVREVADGLGVAFYQWRRPSDCGLSDGDYRDYGHLAGQGGIKFSVFAADLIRRDELLPD